MVLPLETTDTGGAVYFTDPITVEAWRVLRRVSQWSVLCTEHPNPFNSGCNDFVSIAQSSSSNAESVGCHGLFERWKTNQGHGIPCPRKSSCSGEKTGLIAAVVVSLEVSIFQITRYIEHNIATCVPDNDERRVVLARLAASTNTK